MKFAFAICALLFYAMTFAQDATLKIIAKRISPPTGDKVIVADYRVLKVLQGLASNTVIKAGYTIPHPDAPETAVITLEPTNLKDYYTFPDFDASKNTDPVRVDSVDRNYWEGCETGMGDCRPLALSRNTATERWWLMVPCGGTFTTVRLHDENGKTLKELNIDHSQCPPVLDLTGLPDGKYYASMVSSGLGGKIEIHLKTN